MYIPFISNKIRKEKKKILYVNLVYHFLYLFRFQNTVVYPTFTLFNIYNFDKV